MTKRPSLPVEPWVLREPDLRLDLLPQTESLFALSNGHIGLRGNLDEGEPHSMPGSYLNSVYELRPLPYAEAGYGYPESGQTVIDVTNGKLVRLLVEDEPFDVRYGRVLAHERVLDLRAGTLTRELEWQSPADRCVRIRSTRLVSFTHRSVVALEYEVEAVDTETRIVLQSELVANEDLPKPVDDDPRVAAVLEDPLEPVEHSSHGASALLLHRTRGSQLRVAAGMDHEVDAPDDARVSLHSEAVRDWARVTVTAVLQPGQRLRLRKYVSYGWSHERSAPALRDQVAAALTGARHTGFEGLCSQQRAYLDEFWAGADVEVHGDDELQQAVRFALFHVLQAGARAERRPIPAKGLTGPGYDGHCFWDTETFVLPVLVRTFPDAAADALRWRHSTLTQARERAHQLGLHGAAFPWRTISGAECSGYWPAGTAAFHINADIADAVLRYWHATQDESFDREAGTELLVETARLWCSLGHTTRDGEFRIDGVTGPDEYTAIVDNNIYTNLMAQRNLRGAAEAARRNPNVAEHLGVDHAELQRWETSAEAVMMPFDEELGVHAQSQDFTRHERWDFEGTPPEDYPLLMSHPYFDLYRKQVVKQADLVLAMHLRGDAFTDEQKAANFAYYEALTVRDSSLSACTQAVLAAEVGHLELAYAYASEAALTDLHNLRGDVGNGLHIASLAGAWTALVAGFGGLRDGDGQLRFAPRLPEDLTRLAFTVRHRSSRVRVETDGQTTAYELVNGDGPQRVWHYGEALDLHHGKRVERPVPPAPQREAPNHPLHREPLQRSDT